MAKPNRFHGVVSLSGVAGGADGVYWNVENDSRNGTVPIIKSSGTLKLNDKVPGLMTN